MPTAYIADRIFTGTEWLSQHAVICEDRQIKELVPVQSIPPGIEKKIFSQSFLAPAFIDLQIYGAYGRLLAVYPEVDSLQKLKEYCEIGGSAFCLPTIATNRKEVFYKSIDAVKSYWEKGGDGILGLHLEGPWINPAKRGAHVEELIHPPGIKEAEELLNYGKGVIKMITLAPEVCNEEIIELILSHSIIISAGHSNASFAEAITGFERGISAVTHLYNAMSPLKHREPGLVGAAMDHATVMASIIPDGHHVDFAAVRIAKQAMKERLYVITDAVTDTKEGYYQHTAIGDKYEAANILSGSALTMAKAVHNLVNHCRIELGEALRMCSLYPARVLGIDDSMGKIEKGYQARMLLMNEQMEVKQLL